MNKPLKTLLAAAAAGLLAASGLALQAQADDVEPTTTPASWPAEDHGHDHEGHDHDHDHEGHDHGDHDGHDHGDHEGHDHGDHEGHDHDHDHDHDDEGLPAAGV